jgi:hypothetical protein
MFTEEELLTVYIHELKPAHRLHGMLSPRPVPFYPHLTALGC